MILNKYGKVCVLTTTAQGQILLLGARSHEPCAFRDDIYNLCN